MTERIEFGSMGAADAARDEHAEHLCSDDDRRKKTVAFTSDTPEDVLEEAAIESADSRADRGGAGQLDLDEHELDSLDFSREGLNVPWARSVKAIMVDEGVDDWLSFIDPTLTVDEHRELASRAVRDEVGDRLDAEEFVDDRLANTQAAGSQCNNAETHCEEGDEAACGFLTDECGFDEDEAQRLLSDFEEEIPEDEIEGKWLGALRSAWNGYHGANEQIRTALQNIREARNDAEAAAKAVNGIRQAHGQDEIEHFRDLEESVTRIAALGTSAMTVSTESEETVDEDTTEFVDDRDDDEDDLPGPSREFRAAQQDGYLRQGEGDDYDERDGFGEHGVRRRDTKGLEDFEAES